LRLAGVNDLLKHSNDHLGWNHLISLHHRVHLLPNRSFPFVLISDQGINVQVDEPVIRRQLLGDFFPQVVAVCSWSDVDAARLETFVNIFHCLRKAALGADLSAVGLLLKEGN